MEFSSGNNLLYVSPYPLTGLFTCFPIDRLSLHSELHNCTNAKVIVHGSVFIMSNGFLKSGTNISLAALYGTKGGKYRHRDRVSSQSTWMHDKYHRLHIE